jgi:hypothetical protein
VAGFCRPRDALPDAAAVRHDGFTELEEQTIDGCRWWSQRELRDTEEQVYPEQLAEFLPALLDGNWDGRTRPIR